LNFGKSCIIIVKEKSTKEITMSNIVKKGAGNYLNGNKPIYGSLILSEDELVFNKKSIAFQMFGALGVLIGSMFKGKTMLEINVRDIKSITLGKFGLNKKVVEINLRDGSQYRFSLSGVNKWLEELQAVLK